MKDFKVVKCYHSFSNLPNKEAYAVVSTASAPALPEHVEGVYLNDANNMYIIAPSLFEAIIKLDVHLSKIHNWKD